MTRQTIDGKSTQLNLVELIEKLKRCGLTYGNKDQPKSVWFDFGSAIPTTLDSWRGDYSHIALGYKLTGYDNDKDHMAKITAEELINELKSAIRKEFIGWKGGEFTMYKDTPVWVSNPGNADHSVIVDVIDRGWQIILLTSYCEY